MKIRRWVVSALLALSCTLGVTAATVTTSVVTASPAAAHWGEWHQSSCRPDVWYFQVHENRVDYWTAASGYTRVDDHPWSPNGWGVYDRYTQLWWECGQMGAPTSYEYDIWNCYATTNTCGWHRLQDFEGGWILYATEGASAFRARIAFR